VYKQKEGDKIKNLLSRKISATLLSVSLLMVMALFVGVTASTGQGTGISPIGQNENTISIGHGINISTSDLRDVSVISPSGVRENCPISVWNSADNKSYSTGYYTGDFCTPQIAYTDNENAWVWANGQPYIENGKPTNAPAGCGVYPINERTDDKVQSWKEGDPYPVVNGITLIPSTVVGGG